MPTNTPPDLCPKCHKPMRFLLRKYASGRNFQCIDCEGDDPLLPSGRDRQRPVDAG